MYFKCKKNTYKPFKRLQTSFGCFKPVKRLHPTFCIQHNINYNTKKTYAYPLLYRVPIGFDAGPTDKMSGRTDKMSGLAGWSDCQNVRFFAGNGRFAQKDCQIGRFQHSWSKFQHSLINKIYIARDLITFSYSPLQKYRRYNIYLPVIPSSRHPVIPSSRHPVIPSSRHPVIPSSLNMLYNT